MITTILNIKGGCSKTLTAEMLARGYAKEGRKTLVVDADGQGDITSSLMPHINFDQPENVVGGDTVGVHSKPPGKGNYCGLSERKQKDRGLYLAYKDRKH